MIEYYVNKLYNNEFEYYDGFESFCYQNCLRIILENMFGTKAFYYINTALSIEVEDDNEFKIKEKGELRSLLPSINHNVQRLYYSEDERAQHIFEINIKYMYENDAPIIVGVDTYYLPYASNYMKNHAKHTLILCGYDLVNKEVYIVDWYTPWFFKGTISLDDFLAARESKNEYDGTIYSGSSIKNNWAYIMPIHEKNCDELLDETLKLSKDYFYNEARVILALERLKEYLVSIEKVSEYKRVYYFMYSIFNRKKFFMQYLEKYACDKKFDLDSVFINTLKSNIRNWDVLLILILKQSKKYSEKTLDRIINKLEFSIEEEKIMMQEIDNIFACND